jgi:hypothetical protein
MKLGYLSIKDLYGKYFCAGLFKESEFWVSKSFNAT